MTFDNRRFPITKPGVKNPLKSDVDGILFLALPMVMSAVMVIVGMYIQCNMFIFMA